MQYIIKISANGNTRVIPFAKNSRIPLDLLQEYVGGHIETVSCIAHGYVMVINEEGKLLGLPINKVATVLYNSVFDNICGDVILMRTYNSDLCGFNFDTTECLKTLITSIREEINNEH